MNSDLLKRITEAMRASALAVLERKLPGAVGPIECANLADEIANNCGQVVTSFIDSHIGETQLDDARITALRAEAASAGDHAQALICDIALGVVGAGEIDHLRVAAFLSDDDKHRIAAMGVDDCRARCAEVITYSESESKS